MAISRSENMRRVKSKDTSIEIMLRKELWKAGVRYRKNCRDIAGTPDICIKKYKMAVFCDSEFWHGKMLKEGKYPKTNTNYWVPKLKRNAERDELVNKKLLNSGWTVIRFWEKDIRNSPEKCSQIIVKKIEKFKKTNSGK